MSYPPPTVGQIEFYMQSPNKVNVKVYQWNWLWSLRVQSITRSRLISKKSKIFRPLNIIALHLWFGPILCMTSFMNDPSVCHHLFRQQSWEKITRWLIICLLELSVSLHNLQFQSSGPHIFLSSSKWCAVVKWYKRLEYCSTSVSHVGHLKHLEPGKTKEEK